MTTIQRAPRSIRPQIPDGNAVNKKDTAAVGGVASAGVAAEAGGKVGGAAVPETRRTNGAPAATARMDQAARGAQLRAHFEGKAVAGLGAGAAAEVSPSAAKGVGDVGAGAKEASQ